MRTLWQYAIALVMGVTASAAAQPFDLGISTVADGTHGSTVTVDVSVTNGPVEESDGVYSYQFHLLYDPAVITPVDFDVTGTLAAGATADTNFSTAGKAKFAVASATPMTGTDLMHVLFEVVGAKSGSYPSIISLETTADSLQINEDPELLGTTSDGAITVVNAAPAVDNPGAQTVAENDLLSFTVTFSDPDIEDTGNHLFSLANEPSGASIDGSGIFSWTPLYNQAGTYTDVEVIVDDQAGGVTSVFFNITVTNVDTKPDITSPGEQNNAETNVVSLDMSTYASDDDGDVPVFSAAGLPDGLSIDGGTGVISGTISYDAAAGSPYTVRVTVDDQTTSTTEQDTAWVEFTWNVTNTDREPVFTGGATQSQTIAENGTLDAVLATDADSDPIEYALGTGSDPLPDGIILLSGGGFSGTASYGSEGVYVVLIDATAGGATVQAQVTITVTNVDTKPDITSPGEQNNAETNVVSLDMSTYASDDDGDVPVFSAAGLPDGLSIDGGTGVISGTISYDAAAGSPYTVRVTVDDQTTSTTEQDTAWVEFTWNVTNTDREPVFTGGATQSQTIAENGTLDAVLATDADSDPIEYALGTGSDPLPDGIILLSGGGFSGTASYGSEGVYVVLIDATAGGATVQAQVTITVTNVDTKPDITSPGEQNNAETNVVSLDMSTYASDDDGDVPVFSAAGLPDGRASYLCSVRPGCRTA